MQIGMVGLGRMGGNMVRRLIRGGHECVVFDQNSETVNALVNEGAKSGTGLEGFVAALRKPRAVWVMLPAGALTESTIATLGALLEPGDVIIDGGNSFYQDDIRRAKELAAKHVHYVDCGTSGGVWGLERGYCLMIGGDKAIVDRLEPIFATLAPGVGDIPATPGRESHNRQAERGYLHCGPSGAGRFVKMIHNGIEYGLMQAYAEGFDVLRGAASETLPAERRYQFNLPDIAELWRRGSVVGSWLLDLTAAALAENPDLGRYSGAVDDTGEGRWTIRAAIEEAVPTNVLSAALYARFRSRQKDSFADRLLSAMRYKFGGHRAP
jgi:6-phosphogluconate dehydrogenase